MHTKSKIKIDRIVGAPLCFLLNLAVHFIALIVRRSHEMPSTHIRVICIAKYAGMGSIVTAVPLFAALKSKYPYAKLLFISSQKNAALLTRLNLIDERLYVLEESFRSLFISTLALLWRVWRLHPSLYIDLELYSYYSSMIAALSFARNRLGFYRRSTTIKKGLFTQLVFFNTFMPIHELYLQLGRVVGCETISCRPGNNLTILAEDHKEDKRIMSGWLYPSMPLLVINPNASELSLERRWPKEHFAKVIRELVERLPTLHVALVGAPSEHDYVEGLRSSLDNYAKRVRNLAGKLSLGGFLSLLKRANCFLTNDSGPMHIAFALEIPTVALFGPVHPIHYANHANQLNTVILYQPLLCSPCVHHVDSPPCGGNNICMKSIEATGVIEACFAFLTSKSRTQEKLPQLWVPVGPPRAIAPDSYLLGQINLR